MDGAQIKESPAWMRHRLFRVDLRPINNAVDVTNYVMMELGQPMHAFDRQRIEGDKLVIRNAEQGEKLDTLAGKLAVLGEEDLIITDAAKPSVVAGIVGGEESGVQDSTDQILLEAANWDAVAIRKTSTRIGIRTDSSQRFEKSLDPANCLPAIWRAIELLKLTCPDLTPQGGLFDYEWRDEDPLHIPLDLDFVNRRLGKELQLPEVMDILIRLGFEVGMGGTRLDVAVPSFRATKDIAIPEDLVEELGRIHGFNNIEPKPPVFPIQSPIPNRKVKLERVIQHSLVDLGYYEIYCYPMTTDAVEAPFGLSTAGVMRLQNPVSEQHDRMRTSLLPHFAQRIHNAQKEDQNFRFFELGRTYRKVDGEVVEKNGLILGVSQEKSQPGEAFFALKADIYALLNQMKIGSFEIRPKHVNDLKSYQHHYIQAELVKDGQAFGEIYQLTPQYRSKLDLKGEVALAQIDFDLLLAMDKAEYQYQEPQKYPVVNFELSIITPSKETYGFIQKFIFDTSKRVSKVEYVTEYPLEDGTKSLSVRIEFRDRQKTLESDEVKALQDKMISTLAKAGYPLR